MNENITLNLQIGQLLYQNTVHKETGEDITTEFKILGRIEYTDNHVAYVIRNMKTSETKEIKYYDITFDGYHLTINKAIEQLIDKVNSQISRLKMKRSKLEERLI